MHFIYFQAKDAMVVTMGPEDAALLRILVTKGKVIVMVQVMEEAMMVKKDAKEILFVEATTARNLASFSMKRMIVARNQQLLLFNQKMFCFLVLC